MPVNAQSFLGHITDVIRSHGEQVEYRAQTGGVGKIVRASVQSPADAMLVGDMDQEVFTVFIALPDLPVQPQRFDRMLLRGRERNVDGVDVEKWADTPIAWRMIVRG
jgi:hypothetical protein